MNPSNSPTDTNSFREQRRLVINEMGGVSKIKDLKNEGKLTARERIDAVVDAGSFTEIGTFAASNEEAERANTPGDGIITGHATLEGRDISIAADDITVKRASSAIVNQHKLHRTYHQAVDGGTPFIYLAERGGARIPDSLGSEGFAKVGGDPPTLGRRRRRIPYATAILGDSFGGSTLTAAGGDFTVQVDGSCMAMTSERVIKIATGETISSETLGGATHHYNNSGIVDQIAFNEFEAFDHIKNFLSMLPDNAWTPPSALPWNEEILADNSLTEIVPEDRRRVYDMNALLRLVVDDGELVEIRKGYGKSLIAGFGRVGGRTVGIIANQPKFNGGVLTPEACDKASRLVCMCDSFSIPIVSFIDTPGFLVGTAVEHAGLVPKAVMFSQALALAEVPILTFVIRKAFGLAFFSMAGGINLADMVWSWPGSEIGFMDPMVGANVLWSGELGELPEEERAAELKRRADSLASATDPFAPAAIMRLDEIIDPAETRVVLARALKRYEGRPFSPGWERPLASWPSIW